MNPIEQLAIAQALYKSVAAYVKTNDPDNLRGQVDAEYRRLFVETGAKSFEVRIDGVKVGTYSFAEKKSRVSRHLCWDEDYFDEIMEWAIENDCVSLDESKVFDHIDDTGELPPHCGVDEYCYPTEYTPSFKVDVEAVKEALGTGLPAAVHGLLEGGDA